MLKVIENQLIAPFVGKECAHSIINFDFSQIECFKLLISKGLGIGLVAGGAIVKVPQLLNIVNSGSGKGVSIISYALETLALIINVGYNFRQENPFSTFGENVFITISNIAILGFIFHFSNNLIGLGLMINIFGALIYGLVNPNFINSDLLLQLQWSSLFIGISSKLPQVISNFSNGSCGQLSSITVFLTFIGSLARVFTTLQEVKDDVILYGFLAGTALNGILALQIVMYWGKGIRLIFFL